jgi:hypothetical protein
MKNLRRFTLSLLCATLGACSSNDDSSGSGGTASTGDAGSGGQAGQGGNAGSASTAGTGGQGGNAGSASLGGTGGQGGGAGSASLAGAGGGGGGDTTGTSLTGTLGSLGAVQPTVSSFVIANSGETLIYMSSAPITCELLTMSRWLGSVAAGSQVVEIVVPSTRITGTVPVEDGGAEVNYAPGGMSSAYEESAESGSVTFTTSTPNGVFEGSVTATYANPAGNVSGTFHAEFCAGGQGY